MEETRSDVMVHKTSFPRKSKPYNQNLTRNLSKEYLDCALTADDNHWRIHCFSRNRYHTLNRVFDFNVEDLFVFEYIITLKRLRMCNNKTLITIQCTFKSPSIIKSQQWDFNHLWLTQRWIDWHRCWVWISLVGHPLLHECRSNLIQKSTRDKLQSRRSSRMLLIQERTHLWKSHETKKYTLVEFSTSKRDVKRRKQRSSIWRLNLWLRHSNSVKTSHHRIFIDACYHMMWQLLSKTQHDVIAR